MLQITAVCNAGLYLEYADYGLLIDGIAKDFAPFSGTSDRLFEDMLQKRGLFRSLKAEAFTHAHPDHYDPERISCFQSANPSDLFFLPTEQTPESGCNRFGPFHVYYWRAPHMPQDGAEAPLCALCICVGDECVYIASDVILDPSLHRRFLSGITPTVLAVNPVYLSFQPTLNWIRSLELRKLIVYHIPGESDQSGIRRKTERTLQRCADLKTLSPALQFPCIVYSEKDEKHGI